MKDFEFYQDLDLRYPELAICLEDSVDGIAKFYIPILTPILDSSEPYDITDINISKSNILSDTSSMEINACTSSNYLELRLPTKEFMMSSLNSNNGIDNTRTPVQDSCIKGEMFVVVFIGGDPNKPVLIGRYYNAINQ